MKTYGFGIVGCGMISAFHAAGLAETPNARLVAVASRHEANRRKLADKYQVAAYDDYAEMIRRDDIDVVCVCTPSGAHLEPSLAAIRAGKHVVVEKPIEITLERCDEMIQAADEHKVRLCGIFPYRFTPGARTLYKAVQEGRFGRFTLADAYNKWYRPQSYYDGGAWRGTMKLDGGGATMNQGIHAVDLAQWYMGGVEWVCAHTACLTHERIEVEDTAVAVVRYRNGAMGVIECSTSVYPGLDRTIELHGDKGTVIMRSERFHTWEFAEPREEDARIREGLGIGRDAHVEGAADPGAISHANFREEFKDILAAVESGAALPVDGRAARKAVEIILAMYLSAKRKEPVTLPL